jgi:O-antigen ligase
LENIEKEKANGKIVSEIYRQDPNVNTRKIIYQKTWQEIRNHPILGIGWGSINKILGADERGTPLNASNAFLEIWLGSGLLGFLSFLTLLGYVFWRNSKKLLSAISPEAKLFAIFVLSSLSGIIVFNLFNSGILLAFFWVFLAIALI